MGRRLALIALFLLTTGFDFATKEWARSTLEPGRPVPVIEGVWDWQLASNHGAAFSSLEGQTALLAVIAFVLLIGLGIAAARTRPEQRLERIAYAVIAGGGLGNLLDRLRDGAVTDFVAWRWNEHRWPIFNVADVALVVGVLLLFLAALSSKHAPPPRLAGPARGLQERG